MTVSLYSLPAEILIYITKLGNMAPEISLVDRRLRTIALCCFREVNESMVRLYPPLFLPYKEKVEAGLSHIVIFNQNVQFLHQVAKRSNSDRQCPSHVPSERLQWEFNNHTLIITALLEKALQEVRKILTIQV